MAEIVTTGALLVLATGTSQQPGASETRLAPEDFVAGNHTFAFNLHRSLAQPGRNAVWSPYSLTAALALAQYGARGATEQEIAAALRLPTSPDVQTNLARLRAAMLEASRQPEIKLESATGLWAQQDYGFGAECLSQARDSFAVEVRLVNFSSRYDTIRGEINAWAGRHTHGKIPDAVPAGAIAAYTRLVLVNTLYFKGQWASRFSARDTHDKPFEVSPGQSVRVPMMCQSLVTRYAESETAQMVELPYVGSTLSMIVLLPRPPESLGSFERQLSWEQCTNWLDAAHARIVDLELPRFKMQSRLPLIQPLINLGITNAFEGARADFTGFTPRQPLWINFLQQCAIIEVNEEGTVAAAVTSGGFGCSAQPQPAVFHADRPFLFFIRENRTGAMLFLGRVSNPALL